jgi:hypothetical protein
MEQMHKTLNPDDNSALELSSTQTSLTDFVDEHIPNAQEVREFTFKLKATVQV